MFALGFENLQRIFYGKAQDATESVVVVEILKLALNGDQILVALQLTGYLRQAAQCRFDAVAVGLGKVRPPRHHGDVGHHIDRQLPD